VAPNLGKIVCDKPLFWFLSFSCPWYSRTFA
jgi:hypothetical protein